MEFFAVIDANLDAVNFAVRLANFLSSVFAMDTLVFALYFPSSYLTFVLKFILVLLLLILKPKLS